MRADATYGICLQLTTYPGSPSYPHIPPFSGSFCHLPTAPFCLIISAISWQLTATSLLPSILPFLAPHGIPSSPPNSAIYWQLARASVSPSPPLISATSWQLPAAPPLLSFLPIPGSSRQLISASIFFAKGSNYCYC